MNVQEQALAKRLGKCAHCGQALTAENIANALFDYGLDPKAEGTPETEREVDALTFYCPRYRQHESCPLYWPLDREQPAYWVARG